MMIKNLIELGYKIKLIESQQKNLLIKNDLMSNFSTNHKLALLESKQNFNIEVVQYDEINMKEETFLRPKFGDLLNDHQQLLFNLEKVNENKNDYENFQFTDVEIFTTNIETSKIFWKKLGFSSNSENDSILIFNSVLNNKTHSITLTEKQTNTTFLNNHGISCIAFLTNSIVSEKKSLDEAGYYTTDIELLNVGENRFAIFFCKNTCGEIVEFLSIEK
ncbi:MAG: hypothetical protein CL763_09165 [Chloroflexi bacterium]|nr:hypothetical protein [Chloroflexota bacterium]|tara:strand:+ start:6584 stop:7240 length:657 start_codon:yes stop_codon:yes gene_type:complete